MSRLNRIGRYHVDDVWLEDAGSRIVRARDPRLDSAVLIRQLFLPSPPDGAGIGATVEAFRQSAQALGRASHPCLERPCDLGEVDGSAYIVFQRPDPTEFQPLPEVQRGLSSEELIRTAAEVAEALAALGSPPPLAGFHPELVFRSRAGAVKLVPLELAGSAGAGEIPAHAPPASLSGEAALCYSVAAWLYLALAPGAPPPRAQTEAGRPPEALWSLNPSVRAAVDEALQAALHPAASRLASLATLAGRLRPRSHTYTEARPAPPAVVPVPAEGATWVSFGGWVGAAAAGSAAGWLLWHLLPLR